MKKHIITLAAALALAASGIGQVTVIAFDTAENWSSSVAFTSYSTGHVYTESDWTFTGGDALRNTTALQDGVAGAFGTYSWRLRDLNTVVWTASFTGTQSIASVGFDVRRWDGTPSPAFDVTYSTDSGVTFSSAVASINNTFLGDSSNWTSLSYTFLTPVVATSGSATDNLVIKVAATGTTERIMIDNFTVTAIPEPSTYAVIMGVLTLGFIVWRRRQKA